MLLAVPTPTLVLHAQPSGHLFIPTMTELDKNKDAQQQGIAGVLALLIPGILKELIFGQQNILRGEQLPDDLTENMIITSITIPEKESAAITSTLGASIYAASLGTEPIIMSIKGYCFRSCEPNAYYTTLIKIKELYNKYKISNSLTNKPYTLTINNTQYNLYFLSMTSNLNNEGLIPVELTALAIQND